MIDLVPIFLITFKAIALGTCMFFAIKWHYDQDKKKVPARTVLLSGLKVIAALTVLSALLVWGTLSLSRRLGLDLTSF